MKKKNAFTLSLIILNYYLIFIQPLPVSLEIVTNKYLFLSSVVSLRLISFTVLLGASILLSRKIPYFVLAILSFPWTGHIYNFEIYQTLIISLAILSIYLYSEHKSYAKLVLIITVVAYLVYVGQLIKNPNYHLFVTKLKPTNLALEINERQKIEFLATNKAYLLPSMIRKFAHNKPLYATKYSLDQIVGYFDIEQWSLSQQDYTQLQISGVPPKPYFILISAVLLPLVVYSVIKKYKYRKVVFWGLIISLATYFIFEKQYLYKSAFIALPFLALALAQRFNNKFWITICFIVGITSTYNFYQQAEGRYTTDIFYYRQIAEYIQENPSNNYIVTNRFGPTEIYLKYYLKNNLDNIKIQNIDLTKSVPEENTVYIGFAKEITGLHGDSLPENTEIIGKIEGEDQIVSNYGKELWIVKK